MGGIKAGVSIVVGILILISFIGYTGTYDAPGVPKPADGFCGVTSDAYSDVPGSGAMIDIDVTVAWDDDDVWVGIITPEDYAALNKVSGNSNKGELVECTSTESIDFVAGGPSADKSTFDWIPDGEPFHIMIGSLNEKEGDGGSIFPPPPGGIESQNFDGEFDVSVEADVTGGWGIITLLILIEIGAVYLTAKDR